MSWRNSTFEKNYIQQLFLIVEPIVVKLNRSLLNLVLDRILLTYSNLNSCRSKEKKTESYRQDFFFIIEPLQD